MESTITIESLRLDSLAKEKTNSMANETVTAAVRQAIYPKSAPARKRATGVQAGRLIHSDTDALGESGLVLAVGELRGRALDFIDVVRAYFRGYARRRFAWNYREKIMKKELADCQERRCVGRGMRCRTGKWNTRG